MLHIAWWYQLIGIQNSISGYTKKYQLIQKILSKDTQNVISRFLSFFLSQLIHKMLSAEFFLIILCITDTISCINWYYFVYQLILFVFQQKIVCVSTDTIKRINWHFCVGWIRNFAIRNFAPKINFVFREIKVKIVAKFRDITVYLKCHSREKTRFS
jgi:hypothetical protein